MPGVIRVGSRVTGSHGPLVNPPPATGEGGVVAIQAGTQPTRRRRIRSKISGTVIGYLLRMVRQSRS